MREILFRGKLKYTNLPHQKGDWVYGDYVKIKDGNHVMHCIYGYGEVIPETASQYTGGNDMNGKKIFEGDIILVEFEDDDYHSIFSQFEVFFDTERYGWYVRWLNDQNETFCLDEYEGNCKIVGNIHDNPELIGG